MQKQLILLLSSALLMAPAFAADNLAAAIEQVEKPPVAAVQQRVVREVLPPRLVALRGVDANIVATLVVGTARIGVSAANPTINDDWKLVSIGRGAVSVAQVDAKGKVIKTVRLLMDGASDSVSLSGQQMPSGQFYGSPMLPRLPAP